MSACRIEVTTPFPLRQAADGSFEVLIALPGLERWCACASHADAETLEQLLAACE